MKYEMPVGHTVGNVKYVLGQVDLKKRCEPAAEVTFMFLGDGEV